jgi:hypothetical protein
LIYRREIYNRDFARDEEGGGGADGADGNSSFVCVKRPRSTSSSKKTTPRRTKITHVGGATVNARSDNEPVNTTDTNTDTLKTTRSNGAPESKNVFSRIDVPSKPTQLRS